MKQIHKIEDALAMAVIAAPVRDMARHLNPSMAEDYVATAHVALLSRWDKLTDRTVPYIVRCLKNAVIDAHRREMRRQTSPIDTLDWRTEDSLQSHQTIWACHPIQRIILCMKFEWKFSYEEIARILGVPRRCINWMVSEAKKVLDTAPGFVSPADEIFVGLVSHPTGWESVGRLDDGVTRAQAEDHFSRFGRIVMVVGSDIKTKEVGHVTAHSEELQVPQGPGRAGERKGQGAEREPRRSCPVDRVWRRAQAAADRQRQLQPSSGGSPERDSGV